MTAPFTPLADAIRGGYGSVQQVLDHAHHRTVALKRPAPGKPEALRQWQTEVAVLSTVRHDHLIRLLDHGEDAQGPFSLLEWIEGATIDAQLTQKQPFTEADTRPLLQSVLAALQALHAAGYAHGDVDATNVILTGDNVTPQAKLIDLGNATRLDTPAPHTTGSIFSMAPELFDNGAPGIATDLYALGVLGYQMLSGELPFQGETKPQVITAHLRHLRVPLAERCSVSCELAEIIETLIAVQPALRLPAAHRLAPFPD